MIRDRHEVFSFDPAKQSAEQTSFTLFAEWDFHAVEPGVMLEQSGAIRISKTGFYDVEKAKYPSSLPFMTAHAQFLTEMFDMIYEYAALIEKDFKRYDEIYKTFNNVDNSQNGI